MRKTEKERLFVGDEMREQNCKSRSHVSVKLKSCCSYKCSVIGKPPAKSLEDALLLRADVTLILCHKLI